MGDLKAWGGSVISNLELRWWFVHLSSCFLSWKSVWKWSVWRRLCWRWKRRVNRHLKKKFVIDSICIWKLYKKITHSLWYLDFNMKFSLYFYGDFWDCYAGSKNVHSARETPFSKIRNKSNFHPKIVQKFADNLWYPDLNINFGLYFCIDFWNCYDGSKTSVRRVKRHLQKFILNSVCSQKFYKKSQIVFDVPNLVWIWVCDVIIFFGVIMAVWKRPFEWRTDTAAHETPFSKIHIKFNLHLKIAQKITRNLWCLDFHMNLSWYFSDDFWGCYDGLKTSVGAVWSRSCG